MSAGKWLTVQSKAFGPLTVKGDELHAGKLRLVRANVALENKLDYTGIQGKMLMSPDGALRLNGVSGLSVASGKPDWSDRVDDFGYPEAQRRIVVVGPTKLGKLQVVDYTCGFSVRAYFLKALFAKVAGKSRDDDGYGKGGGEAGFLGTTEHRPEAKPGQRWEFVPVDPKGRVGLWVDLSHPAIFKAWETMVQDTQFAGRRCEGIATRNALCKHAGFVPKMLGTYSAKDGSKWPKESDVPGTLTVPMVCWKDESDESAVIAGQIAEGRPVSELARVDVVTTNDGGELPDADVESAQVDDERNPPAAPDPEAALVGAEVRRPRGRPRKETVPIAGTQPAQAQSASVADAGEEPIGDLLKSF